MEAPDAGDLAGIPGTPKQAVPVVIKGHAPPPAGPALALALALATNTGKRRRTASARDPCAANATGRPVQQAPQEAHVAPSVCARHGRYDTPPASIRSWPAGKSGTISAGA